MKTDVLIVGGGLAGLVAAARLGASGARVTVVEKAKQLGGRAQTRTHDGFSLNLGAHALYEGGAALRGLRALGIPIESATTPRRGMVGLVGDALHPLPRDFSSLLTTPLLTFGEKVAVGRLLATLQRGVPRSASGLTVAAWLDALALPTRACEFVAAMLRLSTYGGDLSQVGAADAIRQLKAASRGVHYLHRGWGHLVATLEQVVTRQGGAMRAGDGVCTLDREADGFSVALESGAALSARAVILATPPAVAARLTRGAVSHQGPANRVACLDLALSSIDRTRPWLALGIDRPTYVATPSLIAELAPEGGAVVHAMRYLAKDESGDDFRALLEAEIERVHPGFRERIVHETFLPRMVASHAYPTPGAVRPRVVDPARPALFVAGDWVEGGPMLADLVVDSALRAAEGALSHLGRHHTTMIAS